MSEINKNIEEALLKKIHNELKPSHKSLLLKVFFIHMLSAVITLSFCSQLGIKLFNIPFDLMKHLMIFGASYCDLFCAIFFTSTSFTLISLILKHDEIRFIKFNKTLFISFIILTTIGLFGIMNPEFFINFSILWLIGATLGSIVTIEVMSFLRSKMTI